MPELQVLSEKTKGSLTSYSDQEILENENSIAGVCPFYLVDQEVLEIKTKKGDLVNLRLKSAQKIIDEIIKDCRKSHKAARIIILKARQLGASTYSEGLIYSLSSQQPNRNALIMASEKGKSSYLFEMCKLFQERLALSHPHLAPFLKKSNERKLEWEGLHSQIIIETAENVDATRAFTYQYVHLSEAAFFRDLAAVLKGLQGVPDHEDTLIILESTANGYGNEFHKLWKASEKGHTAWIPVFLPWFIEPEYSMPLINGEMFSLEGIEFDSEGGKMDFITEEKSLKSKYGLQSEQLNWRRWTIINKCNRKVMSFREEHPATADEAFLVSGGCIFDVQKLKRQRDKGIKPLLIGNLVELDDRVVLRPDPTGGFRLYQVPHKGMRCVVGADTSEGIGEDAHAAVALDRASNNTILTYHSNTIDVDQFEIELKKMGKYLNKALVGPESFPSATGYSVTHGLNKIYGNVYKHIVEDKRTKKRTEKLGFYNNKRTRQQAIDQFVEEVREDATELREPMLIEECLTFVQDPETGKIAAQEGCNDDFVVARFIAGKLRQLYPLSQKHTAQPAPDYGKGAPRQKQRKPMTSWSQ